MNDCYGVDPTTPGSILDLGMLLKLFRPSEGRFIAEFPDEWGVHLQEHMAQFSDLQKAKAVEAFASKLRYSLLPSRAIYDPRRSWAENANKIRDEVVQLLGPEGGAATVESFLRLLAAPDAFPDVREQYIPMTIAGYEKAARPLLLTSSKVVLIDRYFKLRYEGRIDRRQELLRSLLEIAARGRRVGCFKLVVDPEVAFVDDHSGKLFKDDFKRIAESAGAGKIICEVLLLDSDHEKRRIDMQSRVSGHGRYLLGMRSGMQFDSGFDLQKGETTHVHWLSESGDVLKPLLELFT